MTTLQAPPERRQVPGNDALTVRTAASMPADAVMLALRTGKSGLDSAEATRRLATWGPNAVRTHHASGFQVLGRQLHSAVLGLLGVTALISFFLGQRTDSIVIGVILCASIGLGFVNELRAEKATEALHSRVTHTAAVRRDGKWTSIDVTTVVPGDLVRLTLGEVVPADLRLLSATALACDESVLTGESSAAEKALAVVATGAALAEITSGALMGTIVQAGTATGLVVSTGGRTEFGRIALGLGERQPETDFQAGLRRFSVLLLQVALTLTSVIFVANLALHRPLLQSLLFSLAIAVGITPQLLPAVVSTCLATGSRQLAKRQVLVKRLVCVEDLGDMDVLVTDKTGTLTEGRISFTAALDPAGAAAQEPLTLGLLSTDLEQGESSELAGGNPLDTALTAARTGSVIGWVRVGVLPFDHERRMTSVVVDGPDGRALIVKGAPESVLARCVGVPEGAQGVLQAQFDSGNRVVAVASRPAPDLTTPVPADEHDLTLRGFLVFLDPPKAAAAQSLHRLALLGINVKICTGDNPRVAEKVCADLGLVSGGTLTGSDLDALDDEALVAAAQLTTIFARVSPEQKARLVKALRQRGRSVGFLGDGVNDALALHAADVGISVDTATDVAKDAADIVLLEKDLGVLADGVTEGRRIFANTIKYVLMGTSSNFGNMFSAAAASAVLSFLPMLPSQILLNNLLYDAGQLSIPTDRVDEEQLQAPSHWDIAFIRRFMLFFGPISSLFDFLTFAVMLGVFSAGPALFRAGWFAESLATQTLVIFVIRTRRTPFTRSRPSNGLIVAALVTVVIGVLLPISPLSHDLGFAPLPFTFFLALVAMVVAYLGLIELAKKLFFANPDGRLPSIRRRGRDHQLQRRAARFSTLAPHGL